MNSDNEFELEAAVVTVVVGIGEVGIYSATIGISTNGPKFLTFVVEEI